MSRTRTGHRGNNRRNLSVKADHGGKKGKGKGRKSGARKSRRREERRDLDQRCRSSQERRRRKKKHRLSKNLPIDPVQDRLSHGTLETARNTGPCPTTKGAKLTT
jgi:hypothetical protein